MGKKTAQKQPNCYECAHRREVPGSAHSRCNNHGAKVTGHPVGIKGGWFFWPVNFDPTWLVTCDGFSTSEEDRKAPTKTLDPLSELMAFFK